MTDDRRLSPRSIRPFAYVLAVTLVAACGAACISLPAFNFGGLPAIRLNPDDPRIAALLKPAPRLPVDHYDYFGAIKTPTEAQRMVADAGLNPLEPLHFLRLGLIKITPELIAKGGDLFRRQFLGDPLAIGGILNFAGAFNQPPVEILLDSFDPAKDPNGTLAFFRDAVVESLIRPKFFTTNLQVRLSRDLRIGSTVFPAGSILDTGADVPEGSILPVGFEAGQISCALCHSSVDPMTGQVVDGRPNLDLNIRLFIALSSNTTAAFLRLSHADFDPMDPKFPRTGRTIVGSDDQPLTLPDPAAFEQAVDDFILNSVPFGSFEAAPDAVTSVTKVPDSFVFGEGGMGWDGGFQVGPFGGVAAFSNAVHTFELNLLSPATFSERIAGIDPEVYLGMILQNSAAPELRIPDGVKPSQWLAENFPAAERLNAVELPQFPDASLFSLNGLVLSPPGELFFESLAALSAFQASLVTPPNRSFENWLAMQSGAVERGAGIFLGVGCADCHAPPFFTNGRVISNDVLHVSPARGIVRRGLEGLLVESELPSFDQQVPLPANPNMLTLPPAPGETSNLDLPKGLDTNAGGYKVTGLLGTYFKAPYLHDASVAVGPDALQIQGDGSYVIVDATRVGVSGTTLINAPVSAAHSLRALVDRDLRAVVVANNRANPDLVRAAIDGAGHDFYVDPQAGFTYAQQTDLIAFLLALDDDPGSF